MILGSVEGTTLGHNDGRFGAVDGCRLGNGDGSTNFVKVGTALFITDGDIDGL